MLRLGIEVAPMSEQRTLIEPEPQPEKRETCGTCRFVWESAHEGGVKAEWCCIEPGKTLPVFEDRTECWRHQRREP